MAPFAELDKHYCSTSRRFGSGPARLLATSAGAIRPNSGRICPPAGPPASTTNEYPPNPTALTNSRRFTPHLTNLSMIQ